MGCLNKHSFSLPWWDQMKMDLDNFMNIKSKLKVYDYWIAEITLFLGYFIILACLLVRHDTKYTSEDTLHLVLLLLWNIFLIFLCLQFPVTYLKREGRLKSAILFNVLSISLWLATMIFLAYFTFLSPYLREYSLIIFSIMAISSLMLMIALYLFFKKTRFSM